MQSKAVTPDEYMGEVTDDKLEALSMLRKTIVENLPKGYVEEMSYGMIGYVVPFSIYPKGYHTNNKLPLPFMALAAQKNSIAFHHMGIYLNPTLSEWFNSEFPKYSKMKLDMGKGCIRFKNTGQIPYTLIGELVKKMEVDEWINLYESFYRKK